MRDTLFVDPIFSDGQFCFNQDVANVFDDMLCRSIPCYQSLLFMMVNMVMDRYRSQSFVKVYDMGCSTGNFLKALLECSKEFSFFVDYCGIDYSVEMLEKCQGISVPEDKGVVTMTHCDLNQPFQFKDMDVCLFNLVLQFLKPESRYPLLKSCYESLSSGGFCFIVEKVYCNDSDTQSLFTRQYHDLKLKNGYSKEEIKNKDSSLRHVLVPFTLDENKSLLAKAGFKIIQPFFQWFNFVGILAVKD